MPLTVAIPYGLAVAVSFLAFPIEKFVPWRAWCLTWLITLATWDASSPTWTTDVYAPLAVTGTLFLAMAAMEAFFEDCEAEQFPIPVLASIGLGSFAMTAGWAFLHYFPAPAKPSVISDVMIVCLVMRAGIASFILLVIGFWATLSRSEWGRRSWLASRTFLQLLVIEGVAVTFCVGSVIRPHVGLYGWLTADAWIHVIRGAIVLTSIVVVPDWKLFARRWQAGGRGGPGALLSARSPQTTASPRHS